MGADGQTLDVLARAHLIQPVAPGRYGLHDLLRGYARELSAALDADEEQHAALGRLFDHYLHTAAAAMDTSYPAERHRRPRIRQPATPVPPLPDPAAALALIEAAEPSFYLLGALARATQRPALEEIQSRLLASLGADRLQQATRRGAESAIEDLLKPPCPTAGQERSIH